MMQRRSNVRPSVTAPAHRSAGPVRRGLLGLAVLVVLAGAGTPLPAADQYPSGPQHRGVITIDGYQIFPENRLGNAVYSDQALVFTLEERAIVDVLPLQREGRFAYLARDADDNLELGVRVLEDLDEPPRIEQVTEDFYHAVMVLDGVVVKKLYRVVQNRILDQLPESRTADGATPGPGGVLFYHVATAEENADGETVFGMALHLATHDDERVRDLDYLIMNTLPRLEMSWVDANRFSYELADGREELLSVSQFQ